jgi:hypothetical protein
LQENPEQPRQTMRKDWVNNDWVKKDWRKNDWRNNEYTNREPIKSMAPTVTIRVAGSLSQGHLTYLDQLVASAIDCALWPLLDLSCLEEVDRVALLYLVGGEGGDFGLVGCPNFIREWMQYEKASRAA